jgi:hypothetical protein
VANRERERGCHWADHLIAFSCGRISSSLEAGLSALIGRDRGRPDICPVTRDVSVKVPALASSCPRSGIISAAA